MGRETLLDGSDSPRKDRIMNTITYLFWVKTCFFLFLAVDIVLFAFNFYVLGGIVLFAGLIIMWRLYRCPVCKCHLDPRLALREMEYCPSCGCDFISHKK